MAYAPRESSFMPTIKCSMCAADIEISMMGDHVCAEAPPVPPLPSLPPAGEPTPPPDSNGSFDRMPYSKPSNNSGLLKPGRQMPPKVDTNAANRPFFLPAEQYTPVSASPSRTGSPFSQPLRSATAPTSLSQRPPSPAFQTGLDSPFPQFPGGKQSRPQTPQPREAPQKQQLQGGYGGFGLQKPEGDSMYAPISPRTATSGGLLQRMNTIAPGPFDPRSRPGTRGQSEVRGHERTKTAGSIRDSPDFTSAPASRGHSQVPSISSIHSHVSKGSMDRGVMAPKVPRKNGYGGFGPPPAAENGFERPPLMSPDSRSQTFPKTSEGQGPNTRRPSEPASTPGFGPRLRRPSNASIRGEENGMPNGTSPPRGRMPSVGPDTSRAPPPRGVSLIRSSRVNSKMGDAPPVPSNLNLAAEFGIGNPYHTPSESTSSNASGYSEGSKASSRSSPPTTSPAKSRRNGSNTSNIDLLMSEIQSSMTDLQPREIPTTAPPLQVKTNMASSPEMRAPKPPVSYSGIQEPKPQGTSYGVQEPKPLRSSYGVQDPSVQAPKSMGPPISMYGVIEPGPQSYGRQDSSMLSPESPTDPAVQGGSASPVFRSRSPGPIDPAVQGGRRSPAPLRADHPPPLERSKTPGTSRRPGTSKGTCKHCKLPIKSGQKSVSSADGRLTGRYHKTCFCCTTCLEPFSTATFYVINDAPYCERHYHKLNGSVCTTCDKGIEGQYLESERREKFHPGCLTCADCRRTLRNDYFEMDGRVFCERDAFRRTQQERQQQQRGRPGYGGGRGGGGLGAGLNVPGGGTSRMQRRTTRLMMM